MYSSSIDPTQTDSSPSSLSSHDDSNFVLAPPIQGLEKSRSFVSVRNWLDSNAFRTMSDETKFHVLARTAAILANEHERGFCSGGVNPSRLLISPQGDIKAFDGEKALFILLNHMTGYTVIESINELNSRSFAKTVMKILLQNAKISIFGQKKFSRLSHTI